MKYTGMVLASRYSQCGCGRPGKGPLDRPAPKTILMGPVLKLAECKPLSTDALKLYVKGHMIKKAVLVQ